MNLPFSDIDADPAMIHSVRWRCLTCLAMVIIVVTLFAVPNGSAKESKNLPLSELDFDVAQSLKNRDAALKQKEESLVSREKELDQVQKEVEEKLAQLVALQKKVEDELATLNQKQDEQFLYLIKIYKAMSLTKLTALLTKMDDPTVVRILKALQIETVAKILPKLDPQRAVLISTKLGMLDSIEF